MNTPHHTTSLQQKITDKRAVRLLCSEAIAQQVKRGEAEASQLRNRRRHLVKQVLKRVPVSVHRSPRKLLHAVTMVLAMWGFVGLSAPQVAEAMPTFKHNMLDGFSVGKNATPTFSDIDGDGDLDAFVGELNGTVKFYRNTGTNLAPVFAAVAGNPLAGVSVGISANPTFTDIDGDGDLDAFVGERYGTVKFFRNNGTNLAPVFAADVAGNPLAGFSVGRSAAPTFADIDGDGDLDAFVGELNGTVKFYRNNGTNLAPVFAANPGTNPLATVAVGAYGYAVPTFADIDGDGDFDVFVGERFSTVKFYRNTGTNLAPVFVADVAGNPLAASVVGRFVAPTFADIDGDGDLDVFVGVRGGTVKFYPNNGTNLAPTFAADVAGNPLATVAVARYSKPTFADIDGDGDLDAFVGEQYGTVKFYRNTAVDTVAQGTGFVADVAGNPLAIFDVGYRAAPTFADIDGDGDLDAFVGEFHGTVKFYRNTGANLAPVFAADVAGNPLAAVAAGAYAQVSPTFADIDGDGDLDAFVNVRNGTVKFYLNRGTNLAPSFAADAAGNPLAGFNVGVYAAPTFADIDGDGDLDALVGENNGTVKFYRNTGTNLAPLFTADAAGNPLAGFNVGSSAAPTFADIDGDGDLDAFVGERYGTVKFFENVDPVPAAVADTLNTFVNIAATTGDVTLNDVFKLGSSVVTFPITAFDPASVQGGTVTSNGNNTFTYLPTVGFSGTDSFTYTLSDGANTAVGRVNVTVAVDTIAPVITAPANLTIAATSSTGIAATDAAIVTFLGGTLATDNAAVTSLTNNAPAVLLIGVTTVTFTVSDAVGNTSTATATVTVTDATAPVVTAPANLTIAATSAMGIALTDAAVTAYLAGVTVTDNVGVTSTTHDAPATLPVGLTTVTFTASDAAGNTSAGTGTVTVAAFVSGTTIPTTGSSGGGCLAPVASSSAMTGLLPMLGMLLAGIRFTKHRKK